MTITINGDGDINATGNDIELNSTGTTDVTLALGGGSVGVGTATPVEKLSISVDDFDGINITNTVANKDPLLKLTSQSTNNWSVQLDASQGDSLQLRYNNAEKIRFLTAGGITFNGDTAAANALDDYEEGTWTPTSVTGSINSYAYADYTKIGNTVNLHVAGIRLSDTTTASTIKISGLPFTPNSAAMGAMMIRFAGTTQAVSVYLGNSGTALELVHTTNSGSWVYLQHSSLTSSSCDLHLSITYQTAA